MKYYNLDKSEWKLDDDVGFPAIGIEDGKWYFFHVDMDYYQSKPYSCIDDAIAGYHRYNHCPNTKPLDLPKWNDLVKP